VQSLTPLTIHHSPNSSIEVAMIPQRWQPLVRLIEARFREFMREPEVIFWVYGFPLVLAVGLGYAFSSTTLKAPDVDVAESPRAEQIAQHLRDDRWQEEKLKVEVLPENVCQDRLKKGKTSLYLIAHAERIEYVYDRARGDSVQARYWTEAILSRKLGQDDAAPKDSLISEPGSRYIDFLLPGLIGMNVMGGGLFGVGFVLVDMRVRKLFKRLMATPMRESDFLLSLLIARLLFLVPEMTSLLCVGYFWFGVPIHGSIFTLLAVILIGAAAFSGIGLLLGCRTEKTESMSGLLNMVMLPMYIFSGVFFPSKQFPDEAQPAIQALPLTQVNDALREVMLEGKSFVDVSWRIGILAAYAVVCFALALRWFKWR
jgi:ABC-2 type transport system permease protein